MNVFKTSILKEAFSGIPTADPTAVGGIGHTPAGIAVLSLLGRFFEFSLLVAVLLFFVKFVHSSVFAKVFPVREEVRTTSRCCRRPFAFKGSVNSTQLNQLPARSKVSRDGKGE